MHHSTASARTVKSFFLIIVFFAFATFLLSMSSVQAAVFNKPDQQYPYNQPDPFEPNNTPVTAKFLPTSTYLTFATKATSDTMSTAADDDWYVVLLNPKRSIVITATSFTGIGGGLLIIEGFADTNGLVITGTTTGIGPASTVRIENNAEQYALYRVRVRNLLGEENPNLFYEYRLDSRISIILSQKRFMPQMARAPYPTVTPGGPLQPGSQLFAGTVQVISVFATGNPALNEGDEYVELRNVGQTPAYLDGWKLKAVRNADNVQLDEYTFPGGSVIAANQSCRIYTNLPFGAENCGFVGGYGNDQPLWPPNGARAVLVNPQGQEMSRFVY